MEQEALKHLVKSVVMRQLAEEAQTLIPIGVSNRHLHLTEADYNKLFPNEKITVKKWLTQPGAFAAQQVVTICGPRGDIDRVRILGPFRKASQLEISKTDARKIGIAAPIRLSGNIEETPGVKLKTASGSSF